MKYRIKYKSKNDSYFIEKKGWIFWNTIGKRPFFSVTDYPYTYYYATLEEAERAMRRACNYDKLCRIKDKVVSKMECE